MLLVSILGPSSIQVSCKSRLHFLWNPVVKPTNQQADMGENLPSEEDGDHFHCQWICLRFL